MLSPETEKFVEVAGLRLRVWEEGTGTPVVLVHGIGASVEYWRYTVDALAGSHRVVAVDLPGCGFSERPRRLPTLSETADLLVGLLDVLGMPRASLIGNSMGGLVCLETALRHPERIAKLVLSNSAGLGREVNVFWRLMAIPGVGHGIVGFNQLLARRNRLNIFFHPRSEPPIVDRCRRWVARPDLADTLVGAAGYGLDLGGQRASIVRTERLRELSAPALIVWGAQDPIIPLAHGARAHRLIRSSRLVVFDNCGHCPQLECPEDFNRVALEFLAT